MFIDRNNCFSACILPIFLSYVGLILSSFYSEVSRSEVELFPPGLEKKSVEHAISLRDQALKKSDAFALVESLTTEIGPRLAGTGAEARAREWAVRHLSEMGFDSVVMEPFNIKAWVRGPESAVLTKPSEQGLAVTALGGSVSTSEVGLEAELVVFQSLVSAFFSYHPFSLFPVQDPLSLYTLTFICSPCILTNFSNESAILFIFL